MSDLISGTAEGLKYMIDLVKASNEIDPHVPKGLPQFMSSILVKSKKLAVPVILFTTITGIVAATGGAAVPAVLGICSGSIGLLSTMRKIYKNSKEPKSDDTTTRALKSDSRGNEDKLNNAIGEMSENISENIKLLETSMKANLTDMKLSLEHIKGKLDNIILQNDTKIEAAFNEIQRRVSGRSYQSASEYLDQMNFTDMHISSHVTLERAREIIMSELKNGKKEALEMYYYLLGLRQKLESMIQMRHFLKDMATSTVCNMDEYLQKNSRDYLRDLEGYWDIMKDVFPDKLKMPTVLVLGKCGTGKSTLCNLIAGLSVDADETMDGFSTSGETAGCTQTTEIKEFCYFGDARRPVKIIDTPGFDDPSKNHDAVIIADFVDVLKKEVKGINLIVLALNGQSPRLEGSLLAMLKIVRGMFSPAVWDNMAVVFTRVPMDRSSIKKRLRTKPDCDTQNAEGFIRSIEESFNPPRESTKLRYVYIDSLYDDENEEEVTALEESKEAFWKILEDNKLFETNHVEKVLTEYASLQTTLKQRESELSEKDRILREYEEKELQRIKKLNAETRTPVKGFTFLQFRNQDFWKPDIDDYLKFIEKMCNTNLKPFKNDESFTETLAEIEKNCDDSIGFVTDDTFFLSSEKLLSRIPRKNHEEKVSQLCFILEISNFTGHFLNELEILMIDGNSKPLSTWYLDESVDDKALAKPCEIHNYESFVIPPYAKERLIFRNSGTIHKTKLQGIITMNVSGNEYPSNTQASSKMMVSFLIDGGRLMNDDSSFCLGFPDMAKNPKEIHSILKKEERGTFFHRINFSRKQEKTAFTSSQKLRYPDFPEPGGFSLNGCFGNAVHSKCVVILSKTPETDLIINPAKAEASKSFVMMHH